jgi:hypothetical protein
LGNQNAFHFHAQEQLRSFSFYRLGRERGKLQYDQKGRNFKGAKI